MYMYCAYVLCLCVLFELCLCVVCMIYVVYVYFVCCAYVLCILGLKGIVELFEHSNGSSTPKNILCFADI